MPHRGYAVSCLSRPSVLAAHRCCCCCCFYRCCCCFYRCCCCCCFYHCCCCCFYRCCCCCCFTTAAAAASTAAAAAAAATVPLAAATPTDSYKTPVCAPTVCGLPPLPAKPTQQNTSATPQRAGWGCVWTEVTTHQVRSFGENKKRAGNSKTDETMKEGRGFPCRVQISGEKDGRTIFSLHNNLLITQPIQHFRDLFTVLKKHILS